MTPLVSQLWPQFMVDPAFASCFGQVIVEHARMLRQSQQVIFTLRSAAPLDKGLCARLLASLQPDYEGFELKIENLFGYAMLDEAALRDLMEEMKRDGVPINGFLDRCTIGITGQNVESADGKVSGVQVYSIDSRAKAASEGLQVGDVITAVDGTPTPDMDKVNELKQDKKAGDKLTLSVYRISTGKTLNITITLTDSHDLEGNDPNAQTQQSQSSQSDNSQQNDGYGSYRFSSPFGSFGW